MRLKKILYGDASDGYNEISNATWSNVRTATSGNSNPGGADAVFIGASYIGGYYYVDQAYLDFHTTGLVGVNITNVWLETYFTTDNASTSWKLQAFLYDWGSTLTTTMYSSAAILNNLLLVASFNTSSIVTNSYQRWSSELLFKSIIPNTQDLRLLINASCVIDNVTPIGVDWVAFASGNSANKPRLIIEHAPRVFP